MPTTNIVVYNNTKANDDWMKSLPSYQQEAGLHDKLAEQQQAEPGDTEAGGAESPKAEKVAQPVQSLARKKKTARRKIELAIAEAANIELVWLFDQLKPHFEELDRKRPKEMQKVELEKLSPLEGDILWQTFRQRLEARLTQAVASGILSLAAIHIALHQEHNDTPLKLQPSTIVSAFEPLIGDMISKITEDTRQAVAQAVSGWYYKPESTLQELVDGLQPTFGERRAQLIGITETTRLNSHVVRETMTALKLNHWRWNAKRDELVCPVCGKKHGQIFTINDPMPPEGSHPGCRCDADPVYDALT